MRWAMLLMVPLAACSSAHGESGGIAAQGSGTQRSYAAANFSQIELRGPDTMQVHSGAGFSVRAQGPADVLDRLVVRVDGDKLIVERRHDAGFHWSSGKNDATVFVTLPRLTGAAVAGSGDMTVDRVAGGDFAAANAGSGTLKIGAMQGGEAEFSVAGSGTIAAQGTVNALKATIAGSGDIDAAGLTTPAANVSMVGSGAMHARVNGQAQVSMMGSGDVDLGPGAKCQVNKMGSGSVRCGA